MFLDFPQLLYILRQRSRILRGCLPLLIVRGGKGKEGVDVGVGVRVWE